MRKLIVGLLIALVGISHAADFDEENVNEDSGELVSIFLMSYMQGEEDVSHMMVNHEETDIRSLKYIFAGRRGIQAGQVGVKAVTRYILGLVEYSHFLNDDDILVDVMEQFDADTFQFYWSLRNVSR